MTLLRRMSCQKPTTRSMDGRVVDSVGCEDHGLLQFLDFICLPRGSLRFMAQSVTVRIGCLYASPLPPSYLKNGTPPGTVSLAWKYRIGKVYMDVVDSARCMARPSPKQRNMQEGSRSSLPVGGSRVSKSRTWIQRVMRRV
jgi:hypothetical protein